MPLAEAAFTRGIPICILKPLSMRRYTGAIEQLEKTDNIDAAVIAEYAAIVQPTLPPKKIKNLLAIKDLLAPHQQVMEIHTKELNRIKVMGKSFERSCKRLIKVFDIEVARLEK